MPTYLVEKIKDGLIKITQVEIETEYNISVSLMSMEAVSNTVAIYWRELSTDTSEHHLFIQYNEFISFTASSAGDAIDKINIIINAGSGVAGSFSSLTGLPSDNTALNTALSLKLTAAVIQTAVTTTRAALIAATPVIGTTYLISDAAPTQNPNANPVYITYTAANGIIDDQYRDGWMFVTVMGKYCKISYNLGTNHIGYFEYPFLNNWAKETINTNAVQNPPITTSGGGGLVNCVQTIIALADANGFASDGNNNIRLDNCRLEIFDVATAAIYNIEMAPGSWLIDGETANAFCYWIKMHEGSKVLMKDGAQVYWVFAYANSNTIVNTQTGGDGTTLTNARIYDGVTVEIPADKSFEGTDITYFKSTFYDTIDINADATPDLSSVAYAGKITLKNTGADVQITAPTGLRGAFTYKFYPKVTNGFTASANVKLKGGIIFTSAATNESWIEFTTSADGLTLFEVNRGSY